MDATLSATKLWSVARAHLLAFAAGMEGAEVVLRERTVLAISGGPTADFNMALVDDSPNLKDVVAEAVKRLNTRGLPGVFMVSADAAKSLAGEIDELGLTPVGEAPLMVFSGAIPAASPDYELVEASDQKDVDVVADMVSSAFAMDREWVGRTFVSAPLAGNSSRIGFYIAKKAGKPMSTVTASGAGSVVGIWSMATPPDLQGRGAGKAALLGAMARRQVMGAKSFFLIATPAGKPLYDSVGYKTVETFPMFMAGSEH